MCSAHTVDLRGLDNETKCVDRKGLGNLGHGSLSDMDVVNRCLFSSVVHVSHAHDGVTVSPRFGREGGGKSSDQKYEGFQKHRNLFFF